MNEDVKGSFVNKDPWKYFNEESEKGLNGVNLVIVNELPEV